MTVSAWLPARVVSVTPTTPHARVLMLDVPGWPGNLPGQHLDVRLTAEDGYQAERSYSLASSGGGARVELAIDEIPDGEVSPYLVREVRAGDELEVKGPLGAYFVWRADDPSPVQLIAGGSGVVPLVAIARARIAASASVSPMRLLYSVRSAGDALYAEEISAFEDRGVTTTWVYTRTAPDGWNGRTGRVDADLLADAARSPSMNPLIFVCGPAGFVEAVADALVASGHDPGRVRTERFGGS